MRIVVDTSIVIAVLANEPSKPEIIEATAGCHLMAPGSIHWEIGNALALQLRRGRLESSHVSALLAEYRRIPIQAVDIELEPTLTVAKSENIHAYDAYMIVCAQQNRVPLMTLDRRLAAAALSQGIELYPTQES